MVKRNIIIFILAAIFTCDAISVDFNDERGITVSAMLGISQYYHSFAVGGHENKYGPVATPRIGYRFNAKWEAGVLFRFEKFGNYSDYGGIGIYGEWSFSRFTSGLRLIAEGHAHSNFCGTDLLGIHTKNMTEVGFTPCVAYHIANSPVDLKLRYLFLGFNHSMRNYKSDAPGCLGRGDWIIDASLRRLEIGASITF